MSPQYSTTNQCIPHKCFCLGNRLIKYRQGKPLALRSKRKRFTKMCTKAFPYKNSGIGDITKVPGSNAWQTEGSRDVTWEQGHLTS